MNMEELKTSKDEEMLEMTKPHTFNDRDVKASRDLLFFLNISTFVI